MRLLLAVLTIAGLLVSCSEEEPFSEEGWRTNAGRKSAMVDDLCERVLRVGMTRSELEEMLGEEDSSIGSLHVSGALGPWPWTPDDIAFWIGKAFNGYDRWLVLYLYEDALTSWRVVETHS